MTSQQRPDTFLRGLLWGLPLSLALWAVILGLALLLTARAEPLTCPGFDHGTRWTVIDCDYTYEGAITAYAGSSNGAYWLFVGDSTGVAAKIYPGYGIDRDVYDNMQPWERVRVRGPLVTEVADEPMFGVPILWREIVPVMSLERLDVARQYPERRPDGSVWLVTAWRDGRYTDRRVT